MSKLVVGVVGFFGVVGLILGVVLTSYISAYNAGNQMEKGIVAAYDNNRNILSQYTAKIGEAAQIPEMQRDDLTKVVEAALSARYGSDGSKAMFQMITEQNPNIDSSVYTKLQKIIEAGRNDFQFAQSQLIDKKRVYETQLGSFWRGFWLKIAGYPKIDLNKYSIVTLEKVERIFDTKKDEVIKLR